MKIKSVPVTFKAGPDAGLEEGQFLVYPSTFTREPDSYGDVVAKGAFARGIAARKEQGITLSGLYGHRMDDPHLNIAAAIDEGEDDHGWWVKGAFDVDEPTAAKVYRLVKSGRIRELSFAFDTLDEGQVELADGRKANELRDLDVFEFSFVPIGANRDTSVVAEKSAAETVREGGADFAARRHNEDGLAAEGKARGGKGVGEGIEGGEQPPGIIGNEDDIIVQSDVGDVPRERGGGAGEGRQGPEGGAFGG